MNRVILAAVWRCGFLCQFNLPPYQAPQPHWYWYFRFALVGLAVRAAFWLVKQWPKENKPQRKPVRASAAPPSPLQQIADWYRSPEDRRSAPSSTGLLTGGYVCAGLSLLFFPPLLGLAGVVCGVVIIKRGQTNQGTALLIVSFVCAALGMLLGVAAS